MNSLDLKDWLRRYNMSAAALARAINYHPDTVARMARGEYLIPTVLELALSTLAKRALDARAKANATAKSRAGYGLS